MDKNWSLQKYRLLRLKAQSRASLGTLPVILFPLRLLLIWVKSTNLAIPLCSSINLNLTRLLRYVDFKEVFKSFMKLPIIPYLLQHKGGRRLRRLMRGYRFLKESEKLGRISAVKIALTNTKIGQCGHSASKLIFGAGLKDSELITRQYLLVRLGGLGLNKALLYALGKSGSAVVYPMPIEWREILRKHGFEVDGFRSAVAWYVFIAQMLAKGVLRTAMLTFNSINEIIRPSASTLGKFAYFDDLTAGNLPQPFQDGRSHDTISWWYDKFGRFGEFDTLCHNVKGIAQTTVEGTPVVSVLAAIPPLTKLRAVIRLLAWGIAASALGFVDIFRNRWWHAFMLMEAAKAAQARLQDSHKLARVYLLNVSNYIYRPLWSYEAAKSGSRITLYFYSINCEPFKRPSGYPPIPFGFQAMNWPHYLVWDEHQAAFVRSSVGLGPRIDITGSIPTHSGVDVPQNLPKRAIAVFDVQPMRDTIYQTLGLDFEYYVPKNAIKFLEDIQQATRIAGRNMVYKPKRQLLNRLHPSYGRAVKNLSNSPNFLEIDPGVSATALIAKCAAVVSTPFTSTAIIGRELGKPSVYYDPFGICERDDRAAHGIPILLGRKELQEWMLTLVPQNLDVAGESLLKK